MTAWWREHNDALLAYEDGTMARGVIPPHLVALLDAVEARFVASSTSTAWPDPHADRAAPWPGRRAPADEEYSRVTDPDRYRILHERVDAWLDELVGRDLGTVEPADADAAWLLPHHHHEGEQLRVVVPHRVDAVPLVVELWGPGPDLPAGVTIGAGAPAVLLDMNPYCGCDACDDGSDRLLQELDEWLLRVLDGSLRAEVTASGTKVLYSDGRWSLEQLDEDEHAARLTVLGARAYTIAATPWDPAWPARESIEE